MDRRFYSEVSSVDCVAGRDAVCEVRRDLRRLQRSAVQSSCLGREGHDAAEGTQRPADSRATCESPHNVKSSN